MLKARKGKSLQITKSVWKERKLTTSVVVRDQDNLVLGGEALERRGKIGLLERAADLRRTTAGQEDGQREREQALEQWLRQVPDDPGALLRRKFEYEARTRAASRSFASWFWRRSRS